MLSWGACFGSFKKTGETFYNKQSNLDVLKEEQIPDNLNERRGKCVVALEKLDGLIISGGIDQNSVAKVASLRLGSNAQRSDLLSIGDHVVSINGFHTSMLKHEEIVKLLRNSGRKVRLDIEYDYFTFYGDPTSSTTKVTQVKLEKETVSFGFTLREGLYSDHTTFLVITHVRFGGPAYRSGVIKAGDRLLAVDGINLASIHLTKALQILQQLKQSALFTIEYDVSYNDVVKNATGPLLVEIDKTPDCILGINLSCLPGPENIIIIESIRQASVAERCGALHVGDHILAIDDIKVDLMALAEVVRLLKSSFGKTVKLEILPFVQSALSYVPGTHIKNDCFDGESQFDFTLTDLNDTSERNPSAEDPWETQEQFDETFLSANKYFIPSQLSERSDFFRHSMYADALHPIEIHKVTLFKDKIYEDFGFSLSDSEFKNGVYIKNIRPGGPADLSNLIRPFDRILQVNGIKCYYAGLVVPIIASSGDRLELVTSRLSYDRNSESNIWTDEERDQNEHPTCFPETLKTL